jgi:hypothetical protein
LNIFYVGEEKKTSEDEEDGADNACHRFFGDSPVDFTIPVHVTSHIVGHQRMNTKNVYLDTNFKLMAVLASDRLAGSPFGQTLQNRGLFNIFRMLEFWEDVRRYLDIDEKYLDPHGMAIKRSMARQINDKYLTFTGRPEYDIFPEHQKKSFYQCLNSQDDNTILNAQDVILQVSMINRDRYIHMHIKYKTCQ